MNPATQVERATIRIGRERSEEPVEGVGGCRLGQGRLARCGQVHDEQSQGQDPCRAPAGTANPRPQPLAREERHAKGGNDRRATTRSLTHHGDAPPHGPDAVQLKAETEREERPHRDHPTAAQGAGGREYGDAGQGHGTGVHPDGGLLHEVASAAIAPPPGQPVDPWQ